jgi:Transposase DDE domain
MPKPSQYSNATADDSQLAAALTTLLSKYVSLTLKHTRITPSEVWAVLSYAAVQQTSLHAATHELPHTPSGNRLREVVMAGLPPRARLQGQLNRILRQQLPARVTRGKTAYELAIDLTYLPYHGQPLADPAELSRNAPKDGTSHFHAYATATLVHQQQRYIVAFCFVEAGTKMVTLLRHLLNRTHNLGVRLKLVLLDKGFYAGEIFRTLARRGVSYIVPARLGKAHRLFRRPGSYRTRHRLAHAQGGAYDVSLVVVKRFQTLHQGKRRATWLGYCCGGWTQHLSFPQVRARYRQRFGIETTYRQMHQVRARTTTRSPLLRLLYVGLALILVNCYVSSRRARRRRAGAPGGAHRLTLRQLTLPLRRTIESWFKLHRDLLYQRFTSFS